jgi:hypothetical protein
MAISTVRGLTSRSCRRSWSLLEHRALRTTAEDRLADVELCVDIIEAMGSGSPVRARVAPVDARA